MLSSLLENYFNHIQAATITEIFLWVLLIIFIAAFLCKRDHRFPLFTAYTPTLLTSLGILGTFAGIIIGLLQFDTLDIDSSIGPLLDGLKTAFISSLTGMLLSIVYKVLVTFGVGIKKQEELVDDDEIASVDFYKVMKAQVESIDQLKKAIAGDDESSLIGVMKLQKSDAADHHKSTKVQMNLIIDSLTELTAQRKKQAERFEAFENTLWQQMQGFADMLSKSATEQVIEALKQVIQDFNNNLIDQFGDNFKALNEAVYKLVEWQDNYKQQLAEMGDKYALGVEAITKTESSVASISEEAKLIPEAMKTLHDVVEVNQHQINELDKHLQAFADIRDKAVAAVPEIREQIDMAISGAAAANDALAVGMKDSAEKIQRALAEGVDDFKNNVNQTNAALIEASQTTANSSEEIRNQFSDALEDINNNMRNLFASLEKSGKELTSSYQEAGQNLINDTGVISNDLAAALDDMRTRFDSSMQEQAKRHHEQADRVFKGLERTIEDALSNTGESVQKQVAMIDKTAEQEIEKVMTSMGSALASISGRFTDDYTKLVQQMKAIVERR